MTEINKTLPLIFRFDVKITNVELIEAPRVHEAYQIIFEFAELCPLIIEEDENRDFDEHFGPSKSITFPFNPYREIACLAVTLTTGEKPIGQYFGTFLDTYLRTHAHTADADEPESIFQKLEFKDPVSHSVLGYANLYITIHCLGSHFFADLPPSFPMSLTAVGDQPQRVSIESEATTDSTTDSAGLETMRKKTHDIFRFETKEKGERSKKGKVILEFSRPKYKQIDLPPYHEDVAVQTDRGKNADKKGFRRK